MLPDRPEKLEFRGEKCETDRLQDCEDRCSELITTGTACEGLGNGTGEASGWFPPATSRCITLQGSVRAISTIDGIKPTDARLSVRDGWATS